MSDEFLNGKLVATNPVGAEHCRLELISATDLVNREKYNIDQMPLLAARISSLREGKTGEDVEKDRHLARDTLAQNRHDSPFEHIAIGFRVITPLAVRSEWHRHRTQSFNEMSMRYLKGEDAKRAVHRFYIPNQFRKQSKTNKQGSSTEPFTPEQNERLRQRMRQKFEEMAQMYEEYVAEDVASEQARGFNPAFQITEFYATALMRNWYNFYELRADEAAQWEIRQYAFDIGRIMKDWFPETWGSISYWKSARLSNEELDVILSGAPLSDQTKMKLAKLRRRP